MSKIAFVFSGQGAQYIGMGKELYNNFDCAKNVFDTATKALGFNVPEMIFDGDEEFLKITENTQPAIVTTSIAAFEVLKEKGIKPDYVAGLSLGEYSAHISSGTIELSDALKLVKKRGKYMQEAVPEGVGTMAAIIGLSNDEVIELCKDACSCGVVELANFNCPEQVVISGEIAAIDKAMELSELKNAKKAIKLAVSAPFHCSMLKAAGENLEKELENVEIKDFNIPIVTSVTGEIVNSKSEIKQLLVDQVSKSVQWEKSINTLIKKGVDTFIEVGPGKVLSGFIKKIDNKLNILNVEDIKSLEKTIQKLNQ